MSTPESGEPAEVVETPDEPRPAPEPETAAAPEEDKSTDQPVEPEAEQDNVPAEATSDEQADEQADEPAATVPAARWWHTSFAAAVGALVFGALSLTPSLLPRSGIVQGLVLGVAIAIGYGLGALVAWLVRQFTGWTKPWPGTPLAWRIFAIVALAVMLVALVYGKHYQDDLTALMGLSAPGLDWYPLVVVVGALVGLLLLAISRAVRRLAHWVTRGVGRFVPARTAYAIGIIAAGTVTVLIINGVLLDGALSAMDSGFKTKNDTTSEGTVQPTSDYVSGGSRSQIPWDDLGRKGRDFIGGVTPTSDLSAFNGSGAMDPIRVYVGLESSSDAQKRAQLAVADLARMGAFDRKVLRVGTTTGTGWVDENAVDPLEYMYNGDTAIVATQYSYLPSWLSFLVDKERAREAGRHLFDAVYAEWSKRPIDARPRLLVFGESLGSFGAEEAFSGLPDIVNRTDGVLFIGPPNTNELWRRYTADRRRRVRRGAAGLRAGQSLRWAQVPDDLNIPTGTWGGTRMLYLQNASDPIVWWAPKLLTTRPDWLEEPRGRDVVPQIHWVPFLTFFQVSADMLNSTGVPDGHGHSYGPNQTWAWASVLQPPGWTDAKTQALMAKLSE